MHFDYFSLFPIISFKGELCSKTKQAGTCISCEAITTTGPTILLFLFLLLHLLLLASTPPPTPLPPPPVPSPHPHILPPRIN